MSVQRRTVIALLLVGTSVAILAQDNQRVEFDVVSIKPTVSNRNGGPGPFVNTSAGRLFARGSVQFFLQYAYGLQSFRIIGGPDWITSERFDIDAKQATGHDDFAQFPQMLRPVLAERFKLTIHREPRQMPAYALRLARSGPKMIAARPDDEPGTRGGNGQLVAKRMTMPALASILARMTSRPVQDRTALTGAFNFTLTWTPDDFQKPDPLGRAPVNSEAPSLFTALQEQLGLKLESTQASVDVVIIDHIERPSEN
jgi:uncharacterized protein (TIGR03435 family)